MSDLRERRKQQLRELIKPFDPRFQAFFIEYMNDPVTEARYQLQTLLHYAYDLRLFVSWLTDQGLTLESLTPDHIKAFMRSLSQYETEFERRYQTREGEISRTVHRVRSNTPRSRSRKAAALRAVFDFLVGQYAMYGGANPVTVALAKSGIKGPKRRASRIPTHLNLGEAQTLLQNAENAERYEGLEHLNLRDLAILTLFLTCALRVSEVVSLDLTSIKDADFRQGSQGLPYLHFIGKGGRERVVPLPLETYRLLLAYAREGRVTESAAPPTDDALFLNRYNQRMSRQAVYRVVKRHTEGLQLEETAGQGYISPHPLRHTALTLLAKQGVDLLVLRDLAGHETVETTKIYTHVAGHQLQEAVSRNPLAQPRRDEE